MTLNSFINRTTEVRALLTYLVFFSYQFIIALELREVLESSSKAYGAILFILAVWLRTFIATLLET